MKRTNRTQYYIVWIEGLSYKRGEKIKTIEQYGNIEYTTKMTEAMRIKEEAIPQMKHFLKRHGISNWTLENAFVRVSYAPKGTLYQGNRVC